MRSFRDLPIRFKLTLLLVILVSVALVLSAGATMYNELRTTEKLMVNQFTTLANVLAANSAVALSVDPAGTQPVLSDLHVEPTIVFACTYDSHGEVAARYGVPGYQDFAPPPPGPDGHVFTHDGYLDVFKRALLRDEFVGTVYLRATTHELRAQTRRSIITGSVVLAVALGIAVLLSFPLQRVISRPILHLADAARKVSTEANYSIRVLREGNDELGLLCDAFNSMLAQIQERDTELGEHRLHLEKLVLERTRSLEDKTRALRESEERLNLALKSSGVGTWTWDLIANTLHWDDYVPPLFGLVPGDFSGRFDDFLKLIEVGQQERFKGEVKLVVERSADLDSEIPVIWPDDSPHELALRGKVYRDELGRPVRMAGVCWDITERKQTEQAVKRQALQLTRLNTELQRSNVELEQFASIASHDLQEPLRKVQAFGDLLASRFPAGLSDEGRDYIQRMQNAAARMRTLINDLLTYSRVASKAQPFTAVDLGVVAQEVASDLEARLQETGGRLEIGELPTIEAEPTQMRQLFQNLIGNALKYHKPDTPPLVQVGSRSIEATFDAGWVVPTTPAMCELTVRDNGIGFEEKYLDRIFAPFVRLHGRGEYEGTGMGLAVCRKIVLRHGGTITAKSVPGEGSIFIVALPLQQAHENAEGD